MWDLSLVGTAKAGCDLGQASGQLGWPRFFASVQKDMPTLFTPVSANKYEIK